MDIIVSSTQINFNNCCRTCLYDGVGEMYDIFEQNEDEVKNICEMLSTYTTIRVTMEDQLPKKLCSSCYNCILSFHNFTNNALNADVKLREYFSKTQILKQEIINCGSCDDYPVVPIKLEIKPDNIDYNYSTEDDIDNNIPDVHEETCLYDIFNESNDCQPLKNRTHKNVKRSKTKKQKDFEENVTVQYTCTLCTEIFTSRKKYAQHLVNHIKDSTEVSVTSESNEKINQILQCEVCSSPFKSIQSLSAHKRIHISKDRVLQCTICSKIFKKLSHLKRHELSHKDNRPYKCTICTKTFATEDALTGHMNMHNGVKDHRCPVCMRTFCQMRTLTNHIKVHTREKPYLCPTCGKTFESTTNLNQHMRRHMGLKLFACNLCPKKFVSKGELKAHGVTHSGEKSYTCSQCNSAFTKRSSLEKHKFKHLGLKPYQCDVCPMKFADKNHLKRHYRIHTGEKPYRCEICDRAFTQSNDLVKHRRTHLGNNVYKCSECSQSFRLKTELRQHISEHFISAQLQAKETANIEPVQTNGKEDLQVLQSN